MSTFKILLLNHLNPYNFHIKKFFITVGFKFSNLNAFSASGGAKILWTTNGTENLFVTSKHDQLIYIFSSSLKLPRLFHEAREDFIYGVVTTCRLCRILQLEYKVRDL